MNLGLGQGHGNARNTPPLVRTDADSREHVRRENDPPDRFLVLLTVPHDPAVAHLLVPGVEDEVFRLAQRAVAPCLQFLIEQLGSPADPGGRQALDPELAHDSRPALKPSCTGRPTSGCPRRVFTSVTGSGSIPPTRRQRSTARSGRDGRQDLAPVRSGSSPRSRPPPLSPECRAVVPARSPCHGLTLARGNMPPLRGKSAYPGRPEPRNNRWQSPNSVGRACHLQVNGGRKAFGYRATLLPFVCTEIRQLSAGFVGPAGYRWRDFNGLSCVSGRSAERSVVTRTGDNLH